jgi:hypothetical protein
VQVSSLNRHPRALHGALEESAMLVVDGCAHEISAFPGIFLGLCIRSTLRAVKQGRPQPLPRSLAMPHRPVSGRRRRRLLTLALLAGTLLGGCTTAPETRQTVRDQANPADRAQRTVTSFTPALRCMDEVMFRTGVRDLTLMMEELRDSTQRVPVSARDMMTSAVSDMTRRSRAVRLSAFGTDQAHLLQLLQQAQKNEAFAVVPQYSLRGAISQIDEDVQRSSGVFGATTALLGLRLGNDVRHSVLGFDAALVDTRDFMLVPGVSSKNTTVITRRDASASDGQAQLRSTSLAFSFSAARSEGTAQAARNMVELAAVELVGKLARLPYWQCLDVPDTHPEVQAELSDWFAGSPPAERLRLMQERLREQRYYDGAADGQDSPALRRAMAAARSAWNAPALQPVPASADDADFFHRIITQALPRAQAAVAPAVAVVAPQLDLRWVGGKPGQTSLQLRADRDGYAYCYAQENGSGTIRRVFPNRSARDPAVRAGQVVEVPGTAAIRLPQQHRYACVHAPTEVYADLPPSLRWGDFEVVRMNSLEAVREAFAQSSGQPIALVEAAPAAEPVARPRPTQPSRLPAADHGTRPAR